MIVKVLVTIRVDDASFDEELSQLRELLGSEDANIDIDAYVAEKVQWGVNNQLALDDIEMDLITAEVTS